MMNFIWVDRLSPFILHFTLQGHEFGIRWYGLAYVFGFILVYFYFQGAAQKQTIHGLDENGLYELTIAAAIGVVAGGRLGFVVQQPREVIANPFFIFEVWQGGMAFFGGLSGVLIALAIVSQKFRIKYWDMIDVAVFPASLGLAVGRIANFVNGELVGKPTHAHFGVIFPNVDLQPRYPSQLFECAATFVLYLSMIALHRVRWVAAREARLSSFFLIIYGLLRFLTDFYRDDDVYWGPFSDGQWFSLGIAVLGGLLLARYAKPTVAAAPAKLNRS